MAELTLGYGRVNASQLAERSNMKLLLKFLYRKWIKGECRHICAGCKYGEQCFLYFE